MTVPRASPLSVSTLVTHQITANLASSNKVIYLENTNELTPEVQYGKYFQNFMYFLPSIVIQ